MIRCKLAGVDCSQASISASLWGQNQGDCRYQDRQQTALPLALLQRSQDATRLERRSLPPRQRGLT
jgi:hypothetical protein